MTWFLVGFWGLVVVAIGLGVVISATDEPDDIGRTRYWPPQS